MPRKKLPAEAIDASVLFETVALGAKIVNAHLMGGERVKEMDHFVATVETPKGTLLGVGRDSVSCHLSLVFLSLVSITLALPFHLAVLL